MRPVKVKAATGIYAAPLLLSEEVGGLPYWRERAPVGGGFTTTICSAWELEPHEVEAINSGGVVILSLYGREPIQPVSLEVAIDLPGQPDPRAQVVP